MEKQQTQNKTTEGPGNNDGSSNRGIFNQEQVVFLQTRLKILDAQKKIYKNLKLEAPTVGQEKLYQMDIVRVEGAIEELSYLIKMSKIA